MNYAQIRQFDIANGEGIRTTLFVSGCTLKCKGCFNKEYQDFNYGNKFTKETEDKLLNYLSFQYNNGLTILGGEPFLQDITLLNFLKRVKTQIKKSIWCFSGFTFEEILKDSEKKKLLEYIDVLVDGRFQENLKDITLRFRGSSNQRIINVPQSLQENRVILYYKNT